MEDIRVNRNGKFVTLTFSNESIKEITEELDKFEGYELDNQIAIRAMHRFRERWRKEFKKAPRKWMITELGGNGTENIHIHGIIWTDEKTEKIERIWKYGYIKVGRETMYGEDNYVNGKTVNYITKYVSKMDFKHKYYKPVILTSPGIGKCYTETMKFEKNKFNGNETIEYYKTDTGNKIGIPIYYRNKLYTEDQREKLWMKKLDEEVRYINGMRIEIGKKGGIEEYWGILKAEQQKNKRLGYGDNTKEWDIIKYENDIRNIMNWKRRNNIKMPAAQQFKGFGYIKNKQQT